MGCGRAEKALIAPAFHRETGKGQPCPGELVWEYEG